MANASLFSTGAPPVTQHVSSARIAGSKETGASVPSASGRRQSARATETFTGAEIEQAFVDALHLAFDEGGEPGELTVGTALTEIVPLHSLMSEKIEGLRQCAKGRARNATHRDRPGNGKRKLDL